MATEQQIRGYVLEEILALLVSNSGYSLLPDASYDPQELVDQPNGLAVRGRGATHQADVLGQLTWVPAFGYPMRLFVEAKYYANQRVGLSVVRSGVGILEDVNQNFQVTPGATSVLLRRRYAYRYALFSATGFDPHAVELAYAHGISLIDLSTPSFSAVLDVVSSIARGVVRSAQLGEPVSLPALRQALRQVLDPSMEVSKPSLGLDLPEDVVALLTRVRERSTLRDLLMGVPDAPFVLVLQPDDLGAFLRYARIHRRHRVHLRYGVGTERTEWEVVPVDPGPLPYRLVFALPAELEQWILGADGSSSSRARHLKGELLRNIVVLWTGEGYDELFRLEYDPRESSLRTSRQ